MKRNTSHCLAILTIMAIALSTTSCIYESPTDDEFFRTLWTSSEEPFDNLTIEFLCEGNITAQADNAAGSYGLYYHQDMTAWFTGLHLIIEEEMILIEEGHRTDDTLLISWHYADSSVSYSTRMQRLSTYQ